MVGVIEIKKELWLDEEALTVWTDFKCLINDIIANNSDVTVDFFDIRTLVEEIEVNYSLNPMQKCGNQDMRRV